LLVAYLFERPYLTASMAMQHLGCESKPAQDAVDRLLHAGILVPTTASGARSRGRPAWWYACPAILAVLREGPHPYPNTPLTTRPATSVNRYSLP